MRITVRIRWDRSKPAPQFTDKEKINLEIYAETQLDPQERERFLSLARDGGSHAHEREGPVSRGR